MKKAINYILLPLYLLWHAVMDRFKVKDDVVLLDDKQIQGAVDVDNIQSIGDDILNNLKVGDVVRKKTDNMKHCYVVSYKEEKHGICLSYFDADYLETVSYDYVEGHWVYNSTDSKEVGDIPFCVFSGSTYALMSKNFNEIVALNIGVYDIGGNTSAKFLIYCKASSEFITLSIASYGSFQSNIEQHMYDYNARYYVTSKTTAYTSGSATYKYLVPEPVSGTDDGKFLKYVSGQLGMQWDNPSGGGTKIYKHELSKTGQPNIIVYNNSPVQMTGLSGMSIIRNNIATYIRGNVVSYVSSSGGVAYTFGYIAKVGSAITVTSEDITWSNASGWTDVVTEL